MLCSFAQKSNEMFMKQNLRINEYGLRNLIDDTDTFLLELCKSSQQAMAVICQVVRVNQSEQLKSWIAVLYLG